MMNSYGLIKFAAYRQATLQTTNRYDHAPKDVFDSLPNYRITLSLLANTP